MRKIGALSNFKFLSGSMLKLIAVVTMLIDHSAVLLCDELSLAQVSLLTVGGTDITLYYLMRKIGRVAFPLFCFLITEGVVHTKDLKRYALRLLGFAIVSEIPFNLLAGGQLLYLSKQNVYFTLLLGVLLICIFQSATGKFQKAVLMAAVAAIAVCLRVDYGLTGALLILLMYLLRNHAAAQVVLSYPLLSGGIAALAAFIPINLYNGQRGFIRSGLMKYGFYIFYPLHIAVLAMIKFLL